MRCWDFTHSDPAMNLAVDEALLQHAESESGGEVLRFWESDRYFVVLGLAQVLHDEVDAASCAADHIPIHRRCSAGGCVLQGPGCLNYSLILDQEKRPEIRGITSSYTAILSEIISAVDHPDLEHVGISDLALNGRKVSGNAQRRRKRFILHHGTLLFDFDMAKISRLLKEPAVRPDYRGARTHADFVQTLDGDQETVKTSIAQLFSPNADPVAYSGAVLDNAQRLVNTKYGTEAWIHRK
jgi:lipoate---protein ligase